MNITQAQRKLRNAIVNHDTHDLDPTIGLLLSVLGSIVEGVPIGRALGAPGDWGYGTSIGDALLAYLQEDRTSETRVVTGLNDDQCGQLADNTALYHLRMELARARDAFPGNEKLLPALMEEVGELAKGLLEGENSTEDYYVEAIQVACVAIRIATEGTSDFPFTLPTED